MDQKTSAAKPVSFLIFGYSAIGALYILYCASTVNLMISMRAASHPRVMTATQELPESDFAIFWYTGKLLSLRIAHELGYQPAPNMWLQQTFPIDLLASNAPPKPAWPYPPTMGLLVILFSFIPLSLSFWIWRIFCILTAGLLLRQAALPWPVIVAGLASPAELHDLLAGQNGALTAGMVVTALMLFDQKPVLSGILAGFLCIKPQVAVGIPAVLLGGSRFRTLLYSIASALTLILLSLLIEGWQFWAWFFSVAQPHSMQELETPFSKRFPAAAFSVFTMARSFSASLSEAWFLQGVSSVLSSILIWRCWRRPDADTTTRMAFTVCLSLLITPYGYAYDLVGFSIAMAALFARAPARQQITLGGLWLFGGYTITFANITGVIITPLAIIAGATLAWRQMRQTNPAQKIG